jgi:mono/diheme cytochrome c family protein
MKRVDIVRWVLVLIPTAAMLTASPLFAADAAKGAQLAGQWCANCHVIGGSAAATLQQGPPSFTAIGRDLTPDQLTTFLSHPHPPMPDVSLTRSEIDDLIAYIRTFR